jgi:hypothetical protein
LPLRHKHCPAIGSMDSSALKKSRRSPIFMK